MPESPLHLASLVGQQPPPESPHLDPMVIATLAEGTIAQFERDGALAHLSACAECRLAVLETASLLEDRAFQIAGPDAPAIRGRSGRRWARPIAAAAAAALVVVVRSATRPAPDAVLRDETVTATAAPQPLAPLGEVDRGRTFTWSRVARADLYRVVLFDAEGNALWETRTADTTAAFTGDSVLRAGVTYLWKIEARTDFDRWVGSGLQAFVPRSGGLRQ